MSDRNSLATVRNLLSSDLRVNLPKDKACAKCSTSDRKISARHSRVFAASENHEKRSTGSSRTTMDCGEFTRKDDGMRLCTVAALCSWTSFMARHSRLRL